MADKNETVRVVVRIRPMSAEESRNGNTVATSADPARGQITVKNPKSSDSEAAKNFSFDNVFGPDVEQKFVYDTCAAGVVNSVLDGYNGTIFAYGQTGSGKTHTMEGRPDPSHLRGIIPNSFEHIFGHVATSTDQQFLVRASYLEIYNEEIRDLLSKNPKNSLEIKENVDSGVYVKDLTMFVVKNVNEIDHVMQAGKKNRSVGATLMNQTSSRSHSIFTIVIECADTTGDHIRVGKLNLVDLAGSERQSKTGATGDRLKEATKINLSLTALGNVISALVDGKSSYIPYRDSKLTRLLQNSLGGNAKTVMCANAGPADYNYDETLSTLRYANRAKNIKNKPKINEDPKDAMLREYQDEIKRLKDQLERAGSGVMIDPNTGKETQIHNARKEIVEKIVEREVIREVQVGATEAEMSAIRDKAETEKQMLMKQAQEDMKQLIDQQSRTAQERAELQSALDKEAEDRAKMEEQKSKLSAKLKMMEEKLIKGGEVISKANKQEAKLKKAEIELREKNERETRMARELSEKEEANLQLEEHFSSLQEEVEVKTKKLKKLWTKFQAASAEVNDLQEEFQSERSDLLDTIRQLTRTLKLKDLVISNFIPEEFSRGIEKRATWTDEDDCWVIQKMDISGNQLQAAKRRPISSNKLRRPESEYARQRKKYDPNPRYKYDNTANMELEMPEKTTQDFDGPGMDSRVDSVLGMGINDDDDDDIVFSTTEPISNPYLQYGTGDSNSEQQTNRKSKKEKGSRKSRDGDDNEEFKSNQSSGRARK
jgi:kinesin family member 3B